MHGNANRDVGGQTAVRARKVRSGHIGNILVGGLPNKIKPFVYPDRFEVRYVSGDGGIRWTNRHRVNVSTVCIGEYVGIEEIDNGVLTVHFGPLKLGRLHERHMRNEDQYGLLERHHL